MNVTSLSSHVSHIIKILTQTTIMLLY